MAFESFQLNDFNYRSKNFIFLCVDMYVFLIHNLVIKRNTNIFTKDNHFVILLWILTVQQNFDLSSRNFDVYYARVVLNPLYVDTVMCNDCIRIAVVCQCIRVAHVWVNLPCVDNYVHKRYSNGDRLVVLKCWKEILLIIFLWQNGIDFKFMIVNWKILIPFHSIGKYLKDFLELQ